MRKLLMSASILAIMASCGKQEAKKDYAVLSGVIKNPKGDKVVLYTPEGQETKSIDLGEDGSFRDTIKNPDGYYFLADANQFTSIFLADGYEVNVDVDANDFYETLTYTGEGKEANDYMKVKAEKENNFRSQSKAIFEKGEQEFLADIDAYKADLEKDLAKVKDKDFVERETKNINYTAVSQKASYERFHGRITENPDFKVSESYPNVMEGVALDNDEDFKQVPAYKQLVLMETFSQAQEEAQAQDKSVAEVLLAKAETLKSGAIRDELLSGASETLRDYNAETKPQFEKIINLLSDKEKKEQLEERVAELRKLEAGKPSPKFVDLENYDGSKTSLDDFKGKFVYVDVWATWCPPCRYEIPYLKALEEEYHSNKELVFVSISIDDEKQKGAWKNMIKDQSMGGVQLIETKDNNSFTKGYNINAIPRFILIGKDGNIISANAPRPSEKESITELFEANGIKK